MGRRGEDLAAELLCRRGFRVLARNWRCGRRELDLVALDGDTIVFVEVKTRGPGPQSAREAINHSKRRHLRQVAAAWLRAHPGWGREFRFDVVAVTREPSGRWRVEHLPEAFFGDDV